MFWGCCIGSASEIAAQAADARVLRLRALFGGIRATPAVCGTPANTPGIFGGGGAGLLCDCFRLFCSHRRKREKTQQKQSEKRARKQKKKKSNKPLNVLQQLWLICTEVLLLKNISLFRLNLYNTHTKVKQTV